MMNGIAEAFASLPDPRRPNAWHHKLLDILTIAFCATLCGAESCGDMASFAQAKEDVLGEFLDMEHGPPSHDTVSRVCRLLDLAAFGACFAAYLSRFAEACIGHVAIDGKALRGAHDWAGGGSPLHMISAVASETRLTLGQLATIRKSTEIPAVRELLALLSLEGCPLTLDALHAQKETAQAILDHQADYVLALKGNQGTLLEDVRLVFEDKQAPIYDHEQTVDGDRGRIETRQAWLCAEIEWLRKEHGWPDLACIGTLSAAREHNGQPVLQARYYLLSRVMTVEEFMRLVRNHWAIENALHWVLDVVMREDHARARKDHAPTNLAILRRMALTVRQASAAKGSTRLKIKTAGWDHRFLRQLIAQC